MPKPIMAAGSCRSFEATLPEGVEFAGDWVSPSPEREAVGMPVYRNTVLLRRSLKIISPTPKS